MCYRLVKYLSSLLCKLGMAGGCQLPLPLSLSLPCQARSIFPSHLLCVCSQDTQMSRPILVIQPPRVYLHVRRFGRDFQFWCSIIPSPPAVPWAMCHPAPSLEKGIGAYIQPRITVGRAAGTENQTCSDWAPPPPQVTVTSFTVAPLWRKSHLADQTEIPIMLCGGSQRAQAGIQSVRSPVDYTHHCLVSSGICRRAEQWKVFVCCLLLQQHGLSTSRQDERGRVLPWRTNSGK